MPQACVNGSIGGFSLDANRSLLGRDEGCRTAGSLAAAMIRSRAFSFTASACGLLGAGTLLVGAWGLGSQRIPLASLSRWLAPEPPTGYRLRLELPESSPVSDGAQLAPAIPPETEVTGVSGEVEVPSERASPPSEFTEAFAPSTRMAAIRFDIRAFGKVAPASDDRIVRASKTLRLGAQRLGSIDLALGQGSVVSVDRQALRALVANDDAQIASVLAGMDGEMITFDTLRDRGVRIRYDPLTDAVVLDSAS